MAAGPRLHLLATPPAPPFWPLASSLCSFRFFVVSFSNDNLIFFDFFNLLHSTTIHVHLNFCFFARLYKEEEPSVENTSAVKLGGSLGALLN